MALEAMTEIPKKCDGMPPAGEVADSMSARLTGNSLWSLGGWVATLLLSFVAAPISVRQLGVEAYGVLALLVTIITPFGLFDLGMGEATVKYMAESFGRNARREAERYFRTTLLFNLIVGLLGTLTIVLSARWMVGSLFNIPVEYHQTARWALYLVGVNWALAQVNQTYISALTALQNYRMLSLGNMLVQGCTVFIGILVLLAGGNLLHLVMSQSACAAAATFFWWLTARARLPGLTLSPHWDRQAFRQTSGMGVWQMVNKIGGLFANRALFWLLGVTLPVAAVGYYNLSYQLVSIVYMVPYRVGLVFFPAVSHLQGQGREQQAARHTVVATWFCSVLGVAAIATMLCFAHDFLRLWVGGQVANEAHLTVRVLALHTAVSMAFAVPNFYLLGTGRSRWLGIMAIAQGLVTFGVACVLVPRLGLIGAAWGVFAGASVHVVVLVILWREVLRKWIGGPIYASAVFGPMIIGVIVGLALAWLRQSWHKGIGWPEMVIAGSGCYMAVFLVILLVDALLPGGAERRGQMLRMFGAVADAVVHPLCGRLRQDVCGTRPTVLERLYRLARTGASRALRAASLR
jgi:O-antigen/teichoic acid export membrane protein